MRLLLCLLMLVITSAIKADPALINETDLAQYWEAQSQFLKLTPAQDKLGTERRAALAKYGEVFVTMDFTIKADGSVSDLVVTEINPPEADPKAFSIVQRLKKYKPAQGVSPTEVRVHVERRRNWIPTSAH